MAKVLVTDTYLEDIGDAIRSVNGEETTYKPSEMAAVIDDFYIEPTGTKSITENGTGIDVKDYASADVNVPNTYTASDEGKVVDEGELVAQGSQTITENGTYDTTLISELIANIEGGGGYTEVNVYAIWFNPNTSANSALSGGIKMTPKENLKAVGVRFFARGTTASVYISDVNGNTLASKIGATLVDGQWNDVLFDSPITLEKDVAYMVWGSNANYPMKYRDSAIISAQFVVVNGSYYSRSRDTLPNNAESGVAYGVDLIIAMYKS